MSKSDEDNQAVQSSSEIKELRNEFQEYREVTVKARNNRRVENIQVLVALGIVGAFISLYSSGTIENEFWQGITSSPFWRIILFVFIGSNALFLVLKLITIPLMPVFENNILSIFHEEVEPFLYLFSVIGVLFAFLIRIVAIPFYSGFDAGTRTFLACISLLVPLLVGVGYSQAYRLSAGFQRNYPSIVIVRDVLEDLEDDGEITKETNELLMKNVISVATPTPLFLPLIREISETIDTIKYMLRKFFRDTSLASKNIIRFLLRFRRVLRHIFSTSLVVPGSLLVADNFYTKSETGDDSEEIDISAEDAKRLRRAIWVLRKKQEHGDLDNIDIVKFKKLIEDISDNIQESDDE